MLEVVEYFFFMGGRIILSMLLLSAVLGAGTAFLQQSGGPFGLTSYVLNFGYTYGMETWNKYGLKGFNTGSPNLDATKAA